MATTGHDRTARPNARRGRLTGIHITTQWRVGATPEEAAAVLGDLGSVARWWHELFSSVEVETSGDAQGLGQRARFRARGWLPGNLDFVGEVVDANLPHGFTMRVRGDLEGRLVCRVIPHGSQLHIRFNWTVRMVKPSLRRMAWLLKPILVRNQRSAFQRGEEAFALEIAHRRSSSFVDWVVTLPNPDASSPVVPRSGGKSNIKLTFQRLTRSFIPSRHTPENEGTDERSAASDDDHDDA